MPTCGNCESHVSSDFARVFSPNRTETVHACPQCATWPEIANGPHDERRL